MAARTSKVSVGISFLCGLSFLCGMILPGSAAIAADEGERCGGAAGIACDQGLWCDPEPGQCGQPDVSGVCVAIPEACTQQFDPVCGCDKKTYPNDCERQRVQAALDHPGECKE